MKHFSTAYTIFKLTELKVKNKYLYAVWPSYKVLSLLITLQSAHAFDRWCNRERQTDKVPNACHTGASITVLVQHRFTGIMNFKTLIEYVSVRPFRA